MEAFTSRSITKLLDDIYFAVREVQSVRMASEKAVRVLDVLHERGWAVVPAEPIKPVREIEPEPEPQPRMQLMGAEETT
jgi:hypothetical protein